MPLSNEAKQALVRRLAWLESPCRPLRDNPEASAPAYEARSKRNYTSSGDNRQRKVNQRLREELEKHGLICQNGFTDAGKRTARLWTWTFWVEELQEAVDRIKQRAAAGDCRSGGFVPETLIAGCPLADWPDPFADLQALLIPAIADGVIEPASSATGETFYRLLPDRIAKDVAVASEPEIDDQLHALYYTEYRAVWQKIVNDETKYSEIGTIPLPSSGELQSGRDPEDLTGIKALFPKPKSRKGKA